MLELFTDHTLKTVALGSAILGIISGLMGTYAVIGKKSLLGDALSHSTLPGIGIAFLITGSKNTETMLIGAMIASFIAAYFIVKIPNNSKLKFDTSLSVVFSSFFGIGLVLLTLIQKMPNSNQAGLDKFIFGQATAFLNKDIKLMAVLCVIVILFVIVFWKEMKIALFDREFADSLGFSSDKINILIAFLIVISVVVGIQMVGVVLMSSMLIAPAVSAKQWTNKLSVMAILSSVIGAVSGVAGTIISAVVPKLPTGPVIIIVVSIIAAVSIIFAPENGVLWRKIKYRSNVGDSR